jgi:hypothetical protein
VAQLVKQVIKVRRELQEILATQVHHLHQQGQPVQPAHKAQRVQLEHKAHRVKSAHKVQRVQQALQA